MTTITTPGRSLEQRMEALTRANTVRVDRAALKRQIKAGEVLPADVVATPPHEAFTMKVFDLLRAVPAFGVVKAQKVMRLVGIGHAKTVGGISDRQRRELTALLRGRS